MVQRNSFCVSFFCESSRKDKSGKSPIYVTIIINGKRSRFPLQRKADPETFDKLMKSKKTNDIKEFCIAIENRIYALQTEFIREGIPVTAANIREYLRTGGVKSYTLEMMWSGYFKLIDQRKGISMTKDTYKRYEAVRDLMFSRYGKEREASSLTREELETLYTELCTGNFNTTAAQKFQKVKTIFTWAFENGNIPGNPSSGIHITKKYKDPVWLTDSEVETIWQHNFKYNPRLEAIRDLLILQASCGLAFTDLQDLQDEDILEQDGTYYISKNRNKTGVKYTAVILPRGVEVLKKYDMKVPKTVSNQKFNAYCKEIATLCGINKNIHSHSFRHTYATELIRRGVDLYTTSRCLGHTNLKQSQHYAKLLDDTVVKNVSEKFKL